MCVNIKQLAQGCYVAVHWLGVEPATSRSLVQHAMFHQITKPKPRPDFWIQILIKIDTKSHY